MSKIQPHAQHEQMRGGPRKVTQQQSENSPWNFWNKTSSKVQPKRGELIGARAEQAFPKDRGSKSSLNPRTLEESRTLQEGDGAADSVGKHARSKDSRSSAVSSVRKWELSAPMDELLEKSRLELRNAILSLREENEELKAEKQQREMASTSGSKASQLTEPIERCRQLESDLAHMQTELEKEKTKSAETEKAKRRALRSLSQMTKCDPYHFDDKHFKNDIENLRYRVDHWVRNQSWRLAEHGSENYKFLKDVSRHYKNYVYSKKGLELVLRGYIWYLFQWRIFGSDVWGEVREEGTNNMLTYWKLRQNIERTVSDKYIELRNEWRVVNARILAARRSESGGRELKDTINELCHIVGDPLSRNVHKHLDVKGLEDLVQRAVDLDTIMQQQRTSYGFFPSTSDPREGPKLVFSESTMEVAGYDDVEPLPTNHQVKLVLAPGLWKYGNSAGKDYSKNCCILPAEVDIMGDATH